MKKHNFIISIFIFILFINVSGCSNLNKTKLVDATGKTIQAVAISDTEINKLSQEYIDYSDKENQLCKDSDPNQKKYIDRLNKILGNANTLNGKKLDVKVYYSNTQNAFACANGSIRVYSGLMDVMADDELFGIIGHEIGHIANKDTKEAFRKALLTSAVLDVIGSTGQTAAKLTESQLGSLASAYSKAQFSQKQEYAADDYGYNYLKKNGKNPKAMASSLRTLQKLYDNPTEKSKLVQMFSTHPEAGKRAARLEKK